MDLVTFQRRGNAESTFEIDISSSSQRHKNIRPTGLTMNTCSVGGIRFVTVLTALSVSSRMKQPLSFAMEFV